MKVSVECTSLEIMKLENYPWKKTIFYQSINNTPFWIPCSIEFTSKHPFWHAKIPNAGGTTLVPGQLKLMICLMDSSCLSIPVSQVKLH